MGQPLDKQKASLYGQFVQAAYLMFKDPHSADPLRPEPAGIPSGYELGAWIHMSDFILDVVEPKFYGIVAHSVAEPDSRIIAIRGTESGVEWIDDAAVLPVPFRPVPSAGRVVQGFDKIYSTMKVVKRPLAKATAPPTGALPEEATLQEFSGSFGDQLDQLAVRQEAERGFVRPLPEGRARLTRLTAVAGHSLGAALATLFVMENDVKRKFDVVSLCTFASPRVGNTEFVNRFNKLPMDSWRIVNTTDVVPKLPPRIPVVLDYGHVDVEYSFNSSDFAKKSLLCCHTMETYLHWLNEASPLLTGCSLSADAPKGR